MRTEFIESTINDFIKMAETKSTNRLEIILKQIDDYLSNLNEIKKFYVNHELVFNNKNTYVINVALLDNQDKLESINFIYEV